MSNDDENKRPATVKQRTNNKDASAEKEKKSATRSVQYKILQRIQPDEVTPTAKKSQIPAESNTAESATNKSQRNRRECLDGTLCFAQLTLLSLVSQAAPIDASPLIRLVSSPLNRSHCQLTAAPTARRFATMVLTAGNNFVSIARKSFVALATNANPVRHDDRILSVAFAFFFSLVFIHVYVHRSVNDGLLRRARIVRSRSDIDVCRVWNENATHYRCIYLYVYVWLYF